MSSTSPDNQKPTIQPPEDDVAMQVDMDEPADHHQSYPPTPTQTPATRHTLPSSQSTVSIPDETYEETRYGLETQVTATSSDDHLRRSIMPVYRLIHPALGKDPVMSPRRANEDEFKKNVKRKGEEHVINLFKVAAEKKSWKALMSDGTSSFLFTLIISITFCRQIYFSSLQLHRDHGRYSTSLWHRNRVSHGPKDRR